MERALVGTVIYTAIIPGTPRLEQYRLVRLAVKDQDGMHCGQFDLRFYDDTHVNLGDHLNVTVSYERP